MHPPLLAQSLMKPQYLTKDTTVMLTRVRWKIFCASGFVHNFKPVSVKQKMSTLFSENNISTSVLFSCEGPYQPIYNNVLS